MVSLLIVLFLTLLNVADNLLGFVSDPIAEDKMFRSSSTFLYQRFFPLDIEIKLQDLNTLIDIFADSAFLFDTD